MKTIYRLDKILSELKSLEEESEVKINDTTDLDYLDILDERISSIRAVVRKLEARILYYADREED